MIGKTDGRRRKIGGYDALTWGSDAFRSWFLSWFMGEY